MPTRLFYVVVQDREPMAPLFLTVDYDWTNDLTSAKLFSTDSEARSVTLPNGGERVVEVQCMFLLRG